MEPRIPQLLLLSFNDYLQFFDTDLVLTHDDDCYIFGDEKFLMKKMIWQRPKKLGQVQRARKYHLPTVDHWPQISLVRFGPE